MTFITHHLANCFFLLLSLLDPMSLSSWMHLVLCNSFYGYVTFHPRYLMWVLPVCRFSFPPFYSCTFPPPKCIFSAPVSLFFIPWMDLILNALMSPVLLAWVPFFTLNVVIYTPSSQVQLFLCSWINPSCNNLFPLVNLFSFPHK